jgi:hypothetical protein
MHSRTNWIKAGMIAGFAAVLVVAMVLPLAGGSQPAGKGSSGINQALAADQSGAGVGDRQLLGLFSESVGQNLKGKIASSQWPQVRNIRLFCSWRGIEEPRKNSFNWRAMDAEVNNALSIGVNSILLTISGPVPGWAVNPNNPGPAYRGPPKRVQDFGDFCGAVAKRYKGYVDYFQIWQEPGWDTDSPAGQKGALYYSGDCDFTYLGMLRSAYGSIKAANPDAYVIAGGMLNGLTRSADNFSHYDTLLKGANQDVSMKITANRNVVAERPMYFNYHGWCTDGTVELGTNAPQTTWYLAEGATHPGFEEWLSIQNPGPVATNVMITYMFPGGRTQQQGLQVGPNTRTTVDVNSAVGPDQDVSAKVSSDQPIIVERPMYFNYHGSLTGGSIGSGVANLSTVWYLAEGATQPGFEEWISLMNPGANWAAVKITYMFPGGGTQVQNVTMKPTSRETVMVNNVVGPNKDVSAKVESTQPIIAERPMYFRYHGVWTGGDSQVGATATNTSWFLSEGTTRNNQADGAFEEWISIQNPGDTTARVHFTYMFGGGATQGASKAILPHSRETILVNNVVGPNKDVSVQLDSDQPIVVERPEYYNYHNNIDGGDVELGCTAANKTWYFAEGTTRQGFDEWTTLQNPNPESTTADITYMFSDGTTQNQSVVLPPNSRTTIGVNRELSMANVSDALAIHPYDFPEWWAWYYNYLRTMMNNYGFSNKELTVTEIGWPHSGRAEFSNQGQADAIGDKGVGSLWGAGCRKIWIFEDVDPAVSWDDAFNGLFDHSGHAMPAWSQYTRWQSVLPNYGNKPGHM